MKINEMSQYNSFSDSIKTKDIIIAIVLVSIPFLFFLYELVPETSVWETWLFKIEFDFYKNAYNFIWQINVKLLTIFILVLWYITCKYNWRNVLLIPLLIELYKFFAIINDELQYFEYVNKADTFIKVLPINILSILLIILISKKFNYYKKEDILNDEITKEISLQLNYVIATDIEKYKIIKRQLEDLKTKKKELGNEKYLTILYELRNTLIKNHVINE